MWSIAAAGIVLGLCQYTYWSAALLPLQFGLFALIWAYWQLRKQPAIQAYQAYGAKRIWGWLGLMALCSLIVFIPLAVLFVSTPLVLQYVSQSSIADRIVNDGRVTWPNHLLNSIRIFVDGPVGLWQGQINQGLAFDWLALAGFWIGLIVMIVRRHYPPYLFLLAGFVVMWLPVPLNDIDFSDLRLPAMLPVHHAISHLRAATVLPVYYAIVAVGLLAAISWLSQRVPVRRQAAVGLVTLILIGAVSGSLNSYNFLVRWPKQPLLSERFNGPILDLARTLAQESRSNDILLPLHLYTHPTMRLFLASLFSESDTPPAEGSPRPAIVVTTSDAAVTNYVWLGRSTGREGMAYLTTPQSSAGLAGLSVAPPLQTYDLAVPLMETAQTVSIPDLELLRSELTQWTVPNPVDYSWNGEVGLVGYEVTPDRIRAGERLQLTLYWQNLVDQPLTHDIFIHAVNSRGEGVGQVDNVMLGDGHRWRAGRLTPTRHTLQLGEWLEPGPYLLRLGLFNTRTGDRLQITAGEDVTVGDELLFGLFYVIEEGAGPDPTRPTTAVQATLGGGIELLGYDLPPALPLNVERMAETPINPQIYWRATQPADKDYTTFVQLLNDRDRLVASYDGQPLNGNYPTSRWQVAEIVVQPMNLTLPPGLEPGRYRLVAGMYDLQTGERLPANDGNGQPLPDNTVTLSNVELTDDAVIFAAP